MIEEKIEALTKEIIALRQTIEKKGLGGDAPAKGAAKASGGTPAKAKPKHSADAVKAKILEVKEKHGMDRAKALIADYGDDLANLLTKPDVFDAAYAAAEEALAEDAVSEDDGDGL